MRHLLVCTHAAMYSTWCDGLISSMVYWVWDYIIHHHTVWCFDGETYLKLSLLIQGVKLDGFWPVCRAFPGRGGCGRDGRRGIGKSFGVAPQTLSFSAFLQQKGHLGIQSCEACEACKARERTAVEEVRIQTLPFAPPRHPLLRSQMNVETMSLTLEATDGRILVKWSRVELEAVTPGTIVIQKKGLTWINKMDLHRLYNDDWRHQDWNTVIFSCPGECATVCMWVNLQVGAKGITQQFTNKLFFGQSQWTEGQCFCFWQINCSRSKEIHPNYNCSIFFFGGVFNCSPSNRECTSWSAFRTPL